MEAGKLIEFTQNFKYTFRYCALTSLTLGSSVKLIEDDVLGGQGRRSTITCYSLRPPTVYTGGVFHNQLDFSTIVYVPAESLSAYKAHDYWGMYDVRPITAPEAIEDVTCDKSNTNSVHKLVRDGQVYILRGDKTYTLQGQEVK